MLTSNYIKTENFITFFPGGNSVVIPSSSYYFDLMTDEILEQAGPLKNVSELPSLIHKLETAKETDFLNVTLDKMKSMSLSGLPLITFWNKLQQNIKPSEDRFALLKAVASGDLVITWTGDLILNSRASFLPKDSASPQVMNAVYTPNKTFNNLSKPAIGGLIEWAANHCPDAGAIYELLVQVQHLQLPIIGKQNSLSNSMLYFTEFTYLDKLEVYGRGVEKVEVTTNNSKYGPLVIRKPHSLQAINEYLKTLNPGTNIVNQPEVVPVRFSGC
jgi:hypothetical protein